MPVWAENFAHWSHEGLCTVGGSLFCSHCGGIASRASEKTELTAQCVAKADPSGRTAKLLDGRHCAELGKRWPDGEQAEQRCKVIKVTFSSGSWEIPACERQFL